MTTRRRLTGFVCLCSALLWLGGCYQRVVAVKGGTYKGTVYEANVPTDEPQTGRSGSKDR